MAKKQILKGWVELDQKPMAQQTFAPDLTSAPARTPRAADAAIKRPKASKLRSVYVRPARGTDASAKLILVDKQNKPKYAQG